MLKKLILSSLLASSSLFAVPAQPDSKHVCKAAEIAQKNIEAMYLPSDMDSCKTNEDCTYTSFNSGRIRSVGINKTAFAAIELMYQDPIYQKVSKLAVDKCRYMYPAVMFQVANSAECDQGTCSAVFSR